MLYYKALDSLSSELTNYFEIGLGKLFFWKDYSFYKTVIWFAPSYSGTRIPDPLANDIRERRGYLDSKVTEATKPKPWKIFRYLSMNVYSRNYLSCKKYCLSRLYH